MRRLGPCLISLLFVLLLCVSPFPCAAEGDALLGDLDTDGLITSADVALLLQQVSEQGTSTTQAPSLEADITADGICDMTDVEILQEYIEKTANGMILPLDDYVYQATFPFHDQDALPYLKVPYVLVNHGKPFFDPSEYSVDETIESYSLLDSLGRCRSAFAIICKETMPTEPRGSIGMIKPSGWHTIRYEIVDGGYLYNRCHLIGYQLAGENANPLNLITGTRYLNTVGMLRFEDRIASYVHRTGNHVLYRATPIFENDDLLARGVLLEAYSMEDHGKSICFAAYCYNVHPGIEIDYHTGESWLEGERPVIETEERTEPSVPSIAIEETSTAHFQEDPTTVTYVLNKRSKRFHEPTCGSVEQIKDKNKVYYSGTREDLIEQGYRPCGSCRP